MEYRIKLSTLMAAVKIAPKHDIRYYLMGAFYDNGIVVATDGHKLITMQAQAGAGQFILPADGIATFGKMVGAKNWSKEVTITMLPDNRARMEFTRDCVLEMALVDGRYPDWKRVIPKDTSACHIGTSAGDRPHFNPFYLVQIEEAAQIYRNAKSDLLMQTRIWSRGLNNGAYVQGPDGFEGVVMGMVD